MSFSRKVGLFATKSACIHPSQARAEAFTKAKDKAAEMALETAKQEGWHFPDFPNGIPEMEKHLAGLGKLHVLRIEVSVMNSATSIQKDGLENMIFPDATSLHTLRQAAKKEVERDLMTQIQSYAKELDPTWYAVALCCFPSSSFHKKISVVGPRVCFLISTIHCCTGWLQIMKSSNSWIV